MLTESRLLARGHPALSRAVPEPALPPASAASAAAVSRLVMFVGAALRPEDALAAELARDGVRTLWRASTEQAVRTAQLATFDAVCVDTSTLGAGAAGVIGRLRAALPCPLLVVGSGVDARDEIDALEQGADLYLARPLPPRRLCAHLIALLRRRALAAEEPPAAKHPAPLLAEPDAPPTGLLESLVSAVSRGHAVAEVDGAVSVRASSSGGGLEVTIRGLQLRLR